MLDLTSRTAFELHLEVQRLKRSVATLKGRVKQLEKAARPDYAPLVVERTLVKDILDLVCREAQLTPAEIVSERRDERTLRARYATCWLAHRFARQSFTMIGRCLGRDPSSVGHAVHKTDRRIKGVVCPVEDTPEAWARVLLDHHR